MEEGLWGCLGGFGGVNNLPTVMDSLSKFTKKKEKEKRDNVRARGQACGCGDEEEGGRWSALRNIISSIWFIQGLSQYCSVYFPSQNEGKHSCLIKKKILWLFVFSPMFTTP